MLVASWKTTLFRGADPQKVADEIAAIGDSASPQDILEMGRNPETELHKCFEWDDTAAAEKYRLQQARNIVCNLVIKETEDQEENRIPVRMFYKTNASDGYKATSFILRNPDEYAELLKRAFRELSSFKRKYSALAELDGVFLEIDKLETA